MPLIVNGWTIKFHDLIKGQISQLMEAAARAKAADNTNVKVFIGVASAILDRIPQNPGDRRFRQGKTLGRTGKVWFRDKSGNGRYRLFFRYDEKRKVIICAWVNDQNTFRKAGVKSDAYTVFAKMLGRGNPPSDWDALEKACDEDSPESMLRQTKDLLHGDGKPTKDLAGERKTGRG